MKENIIQFDSYLLCDMVLSGADQFDGNFISSQTGLSTKATIKAKTSEKDPICLVPWHRKITLSSRFLNRPFRVAHPVLRNYTFVIDDFLLKEPLKTIRVPLLYKVLSQAGLINIGGLKYGKM